MSVGTLSVELQLAYAKFQDDLGKASAEAEAHSRRIERSINGAFDSIRSKAVHLAEGLGAAFSAKAFVDLIKGAIDAEEELGLLGARAGLSGEQLSTLSRAALLSHTGLEDVATMSQRLSKALLEFGNDSAKSTQILKALGFTAAQVPGLLADPSKAVLEFARNINDLPEGGVKAGAQLLALGRAGGTTSAFLNELAKQTSLVVTRTNEEIAAAKEFNDKLTDMGIRSANVKTALANALLPTLGDVVDALTKLTTGTGGAQAGISKLTADGSIKQWARDGALVLGTLAESLVLIGRLVSAVTGSFRVVAADVGAGAASIQLQNLVQYGGTPEQFAAAEANLKKSLESRNKTLETANTNYEELWNKNGTFITDALRKQFDEADKAASGGGTGGGFAGGSADAIQRRAEAAAAKAKAVQNALNKSNKSGDDPAKKILEAQLKALDASVEEEKRTLTARNDFLTQYYERGDISLKEFYAKRQDSITEGLAFEEKAYADELAIIVQGIANAKKAVDRAELGVKQIEVIKKRTLAEQDAAKQGISLWFEEQKAAEAYANSVKSVAADILELQGKTAAAAKIRLEVQDTAQRKSFAQDPAALAQLEALERLKTQQAEFNQLQTESSNIYARIALEVSKIDFAQQHEGTSELQTLAAKSRAGQGYINVLRAQAEAALAIAKASGNEAEIIQAEQMLQKLDELAAAADVLKEKFDGIVTTEFTTALDAIIGKTKSVKQAVLDMAKGIEQSITHLIDEDLSKRLYKSLFGGSDSASGFDLGGLLSKLFGGGGGASGAGSFADLPTGFGDIPAFATGTSYVPHDMIAQIHEGEAIVPKALNVGGGKRGDVHIHNNTTIMPGASRESVDHALSRQAQNTRLALARTD